MASCDSRTLDGNAVERDPRPRCREICNIRECDPTRSEFVCNYLEDRILPKSPRPPRIKPRQLREMGINPYGGANHVMRVMDEFEPDQFPLIDDVDF